jgi:type II secretory pathway pseudopilin PulG
MLVTGNILPVRAGIDRGDLSSSANNAYARKAVSAFTLPEVMVGISLAALMGIALYAGIGVAFSQLRLSRENLRATQILEGKMEVVRQYNWDQVVNLPGFIPSSFTESFFADNPTNTPSNFVYTGTVTVTNAPITETYSNDLKMIQIALTWKSGGITHKRQATTFVSQYGLQRYVY